MYIVQGPKFIEASMEACRFSYGSPFKELF
jgi:hypothetical protein